MFNLFRSRDKVVRFFLGALLVLVSLSMLTYLIPSYNSGGSSDMIVAQVGKETITVPEVQQTVQASLRGRSLPPELMPHYVPQVIESMITDRALAYEAKRLGLQVTDQQVADAIRSLLPSLFPDGKFAGTDAYAALLAQQNMTIEQFESTLKRQLLVTRLRDIALEGTVVSPLEIEQEFRHRNDKAKIEYVKIPADKLRSEVQVTPQEMENYYNASKAAFQVPETKTLGILIVDQEKVAQSITPTDAELQRMYDQNKDSFRTPERVKVRHILLTTTGKTPQEEAAIKAKAEDLLKQVKAGANFADLARKYSNDPGSASKGGDLDWIVRGQTVPEFEQAAFSLKPGETSNLIKTQYGYHIIQVLAKEPAHLKTFEEVKNDLAAEYKKQQVNQRMQSLSDNVEAALKKNPLHPEQVAAALGVEFVQADKVGSGDSIPAVGDSKEFQDSTTGLSKGEVSQPVLIAGNKLAAASVLDVFPAHQASYQEAEPRLREAILKDKVAKLQTQKADELAAKAKASGDLRKAAQSLGYEVKTSDDFTRLGAVEGLGSANYVMDAFSKPVGTIVGPVGIPDAKVVYKVLGHVDADLSKLPAERVAIRDELKSKMGQERNSLFESGLRDMLIREGKIKIHQDVIKRLTSAYNG